MRAPIHAFIPDAGVRRANGLLWGVETHGAERPDDTDQMISMMDERLRAAGIAAEGDTVVMAASMPAGRTTTNMLKVHLVGSLEGPSRARGRQGARQHKQAVVPGSEDA